jgi:hypothetical protein
LEIDVFLSPNWQMCFLLEILIFIIS